MRIEAWQRLHVGGPVRFSQGFSFEQEIENHFDQGVLSRFYTACFPDKGFRLSQDRDVSIRNA
jgi:hypothetical protein